MSKHLHAKNRKHFNTRRDITLERIQDNVLEHNDPLGEANLFSSMLIGQQSQIILSSNSANNSLIKSTKRSVQGKNDHHSSSLLRPSLQQTDAQTHSYLTQAHGRDTDAETPQMASLREHSKEYPADGSKGSLMRRERGHESAKQSTLADQEAALALERSTGSMAGKGSKLATAELSRDYDEREAGGSQASRAHLNVHMYSAAGTKGDAASAYEVRIPARASEQGPNSLSRKNMQILQKGLFQ